MFIITKYCKSFDISGNIIHWKCNIKYLKSIKHLYTISIKGKCLGGFCASNSRYLFNNPNNTYKEKK